VWLGAIDVLREAEQALEANVNLKQVMEHLVVQWARLSNEQSMTV
jgi:hypothetical protein